MQLNIKNFSTSIPNELVALARKNVVREFDETEKGNFVAYVDEGEDKSFDVSLIIDKSGEIVGSECDCKIKAPFCRHKIALALRITGEQKKSKKITKTSNKNNLSFSLVDDVPITDLKDWLKNIFVHNSPMEMAFVHHFGEKNKSYTPAEIEQITHDALKAVVKNKKLIDLTQLKKIIELWTDVHAPVFAQYKNDVADDSLFKNVHALIESCINVYYSLNINNKKIPAYIEASLKDCLPPLMAIADDAKFIRANSYYIDHLVDNSGAIRFIYLKHMLDAVDESNTTRRMLLVDQLLKKYQDTKPGIRTHASFTKCIFDMVLKYDLGNKYYKIFRPITWQNDYNLKLIKLLILNKQFKLSEKYCRVQIASNAKDEYNVPYYELLKEIYVLTNDKEGLASVLSALLPLSFSFNDYLYISKQMQDEEQRKKWRSKILTRARSASRSNTNALWFCFQVADSEKKYAKMIEYIQENTTYSMILEFLSPMLLSDKDNLLRALMLKSESWRGGLDEELDAADNIPLIYKEMEKAFSRDHLKKVVLHWRKKWSYSRNKFINFIEGLSD